MDRAGGMEYFVGLGADGMPRFSAAEADASPLFADYEQGSAAPHNCMGEVGVEWNRFVKRWVMLYNCLNDTPTNPRGVYMRLAEQPWGPWSAPQTIFSPVRDGGFCGFIHRAVTPTNPACDDLSAPNEARRGGRWLRAVLSLPLHDRRCGARDFDLLLHCSPHGTHTRQVIMKATIQVTP